MPGEAGVDYVSYIVACDVGMRLVGTARREGKSVTVDVSRNGQQVFHYAIRAPRPTTTPGYGARAGWSTGSATAPSTWVEDTPARTRASRRARSLIRPNTPRMVAPSQRSSKV